MLGNEFYIAYWQLYLLSGVLDTFWGFGVFPFLYAPNMHSCLLSVFICIQYVNYIHFGKWAVRIFMLTELKKKKYICVNFAIIVPVIVSILVGKHTLETV